MTCTAALSAAPPAAGGRLQPQRPAGIGGVPRTVARPALWPLGAGRSITSIGGQQKRLGGAPARGAGGRYAGARRLRFPWRARSSGGDAEETGIVPSWDEADSSDASAVAENEHQPSERRSLQMTFTCNSCEGRTTRLVSPNAMAKGTVYVQCGTCETWHQIVDNLNLIHEYNLEDEPEDFPPEEA